MPAPHSRFARLFRSSFASLLLLGLLVTPMTLGYWHGYKLSEVVGEITAYRYFYTLRLLWGHGESPWVPNGHTVGYVFYCVNYLYKIAGLSWRNTGFRIDVVLVTVNLLFVGSAALLLRFALPNRFGLHARIVLGLLGLTILYQQTIEAGFFTLVPDYPNLVLALALACLALAHRVLDRAPSLLTLLLLTLYGVFCIATKVTFVAFYVPLALLYLVQPGRFWQRGLRLVCVAILPLAGALYFLWLYHRFSWRATEFNLNFMLEFIRNSQVKPPQPYTVWLWGTLRQQWADLSYFSCAATLAPYLLGLALLCLPHRLVTGAFLPGSLIGHSLIFHRDQSHSYIEVNFFLFSYLALYATRVYLARAGQRPAEAAATSPKIRYLRLSLYLPLFALVFFYMQRGLPQINARLRECNGTGEAVSSFLQTHRGRTLFLIPNNSYALPSLDSAISKGGTDMHSNTWGDSPLMVRLFPERTYLFGYSPLSEPYNTSPYDNLVFSVLFNDEKGDAAQLDKLFGVKLDKFAKTLDYKINDNVRVIGYSRVHKHAAPAPIPLQPSITPDLLRRETHPRSFQLTPGNAGKISSANATDPIPHLHLQAQSESSYLAYSTFQMDTPFNGGSLHFRTTVLSPTKTKILLQVQYRVAGSEPQTLGREFYLAAPSTWQTFDWECPLPRTACRIVNFSVAITDVHRDESFELAELTAVAYPNADPAAP